MYRLVVDDASQVIEDESTRQTRQINEQTRRYQAKPKRADQPNMCC
jgi:hypothetical protein